MPSPVVGYSQSGLQNNATIVTPQFINCSGGQMDVQDLIATGPNIEDNVRIQFLSSTGVATNIVMWADGEELDKPTKGYCWADTGWGAKIEGIKIAPGQGLWGLGKNTDQYLVFPHPEL